MLASNWIHNVTPIARTIEQLRALKNGNKTVLAVAQAQHALAIRFNQELRETRKVYSTLYDKLHNFGETSGMPAGRNGRACQMRCVARATTEMAAAGGLARHGGDGGSVDVLHHVNACEYRDRLADVVHDLRMVESGGRARRPTAGRRTTTRKGAAARLTDRDGFTVTAATFTEERCLDAQHLVDIMVPPVLVAYTLLESRSCRAWTFEPDHIVVQLADGKSVKTTFDDLATHATPWLPDATTTLTQKLRSVVSSVSSKKRRTDAGGRAAACDPLLKNPLYWLRGAPLSDAELRQLCFECSSCRVSSPHAIPATVATVARRHSRRSRSAGAAPTTQPMLALTLRFDSLNDEYAVQAAAAAGGRKKTATRLHWTAPRGDTDALRAMRSLPGTLQWNYRGGSDEDDGAGTGGGGGESGTATFRTEAPEAAALFGGGGGDTGAETAVSIDVQDVQRYLRFTHEPGRTVNAYGREYEQPYVMNFSTDPSGHERFTVFDPAPYQQAVTDRVALSNQRALLINHYMGTGKTLTALTAMYFLATRRMAIRYFIVIAPDSILTEWHAEMDGWGIPHEIRARVFLMGYQQALEWDTAVPEDIKRIASESMFVLDEAHRFTEAFERAEGEAVTDSLALEARATTNPLQRKWMRLAEVVESSKRLMLLTGTPVYRSAFDLSILVNLMSRNSSGVNALPTDVAEFNRSFMTLDKVQARTRGQLTPALGSKVAGSAAAFAVELKLAPIFSVFGSWPAIAAEYGMKAWMTSQYMRQFTEPVSTVVWHHVNRHKLIAGLRPYVDYFDLADFEASQAAFPWKKMRMEYVPYTAQQFLTFVAATLNASTGNEMRNSGILDPRVHDNDYVTDAHFLQYNAQDVYTNAILLNPLGRVLPGERRRSKAAAEADEAESAATDYSVGAWISWAASSLSTLFQLDSPRVEKEVRQQVEKIVYERLQLAASTMPYVQIIKKERADQDYATNPHFADMEVPTAAEAQVTLGTAGLFDPREGMPVDDAQIAAAVARGTPEGYRAAYEAGAGGFVMIGGQFYRAVAYPAGKVRYELTAGDPICSTDAEQKRLYRTPFDAAENAVVDFKEAAALLNSDLRAGPRAAATGAGTLWYEVPERETVTWYSNGTCEVAIAKKEQSALCSSALFGPLPHNADEHAVRRYLLSHGLRPRGVRGARHAQWEKCEDVEKLGATRWSAWTAALEQAGLLRDGAPRLWEITFWTVEQRDAALNISFTEPFETRAHVVPGANMWSATQSVPALSKSVSALMDACTLCVGRFESTPAPATDTAPPQTGRRRTTKAAPGAAPRSRAPRSRAPRSRKSAVRRFVVDPKDLANEAMTQMAEEVAQRRVSSSKPPTATATATAKAKARARERANTTAKASGGQASRDPTNPLDRTGPAAGIRSARSHVTAAMQQWLRPFVTKVTANHAQRTACHPFALQLDDPAAPATTADGQLATVYFTSPGLCSAVLAEELAARRDQVARGEPPLFKLRRRGWIHAQDDDQATPTPSSERLRDIFQSAHARQIHNDHTMLRIGNMQVTRTVRDGARSRTMTAYPPKWHKMFDEYLDKGDLSDKNRGDIIYFEKQRETVSRKAARHVRRRNQLLAHRPSLNVDEVNKRIARQPYSLVLAKLIDETTATGTDMVPPEWQADKKTQYDTDYTYTFNPNGMLLDDAGQLQYPWKGKKSDTRPPEASCPGLWQLLCDTPVGEMPRATVLEKLRPKVTTVQYNCVNRGAGDDAAAPRTFAETNTHPRSVVYSQLSDGVGGLYQFKHFLVREKGAWAYEPSTVKDGPAAWWTWDNDAYRYRRRSETPPPGAFRVCMMDRLVGSHPSYRKGEKVLVSVEGNDWPAHIVRRTADDSSTYVVRSVGGGGNGGTGKGELEVHVDDIRSSRAGQTAAQNQNAKNAFNRGEIDCVLIHYSITEGISFKNVRQIHIAEPIESPAQWEQVIARAARNKSHMALEPQDRYVQVITWACVVPSQGGYITDIDPYLDRNSTLKVGAAALGIGFLTGAAASAGILMGTAAGAIAGTAFYTQQKKDLSLVKTGRLAVTALSCGTLQMMLNVVTALRGKNTELGLGSIETQLANATLESFASAQESEEYQRAMRESAKIWHRAMPYSNFQSEEVGLLNSPDTNILRTCNKRMQSVIGLKKALTDLYTDSATFYPNAVNRTQRWGVDAEDGRSSDPAEMELLGGEWRPVRASKDVQRVRQENDAVYKNMYEGPHTRITSVHSKYVTSRPQVSDRARASHGSKRDSQASKRASHAGKRTSRRTSKQ